MAASMEDFFLPGHNWCIQIPAKIKLAQNGHDEGSIISEWASEASECSFLGNCLQQTLTITFIFQTARPEQIQKLRAATESGTKGSV